MSGFADRYTDTELIHTYIHTYMHTYIHILKATWTDNVRMHVHIHNTRAYKTMVIKN